MNKYISLIIQEGTLKSYFPESEVIRRGEKEILWIHNLQPTPLSNTYTVGLHYIRGKNIKVYVLKPNPLPLAKGATQLPHVYSTPKQQLCLYYPKDKEWTPNKLYVKTIIPWASEWLLHYEIWAGTGEWQGGGIEHPEITEEIDL